MPAHNLLIAGEELLLSPDRAVYWPARRTLFVADLHLGKAATFRAAAIPVPAGTTASDLARLTRLIDTHQPERLVVLGDLLHAPSGRSDSLIDTVSQWRTTCPQLQITLIQGNHDDRAGLPPTPWNMTVERGPVIEPPFVLDHYPAPHPDGFMLAGHWHPKVALSGKAQQRLKVPCFLIRQELMVLPAFCRFADGKAVAVQPNDRLFGIAGESVIECPVQVGAA